VLQLALGDAGADVWCANDGPAALEIMASAQPHLMLLDLHMPGMDGWAVMQRLRKRSRLAEIPVVLLTSDGDFDCFDRARKQSVAAFLSKPFRLGEVISTCRRVLDGARPLQGIHELPLEAPAVSIRDEQGALLGVGRLLDIDVRGAQIDLEQRLPIASRVVLGLPDGTVLVAEVRWVTTVHGRFHHGLQSRPS